MLRTTSRHSHASRNARVAFVGRAVAALLLIIGGLWANACSAKGGGKTLEADTETTTESGGPEAGWNRFHADDVELWLPPSWDGGSPSEGDLDLIIERLRNIGGNYEGLAALVEQQTEAILLLMIDQTVGRSAFLTNVTLAEQDVPSAVSIETFLSASANAIRDYLADNVTVITQERVSLAHFESAGRLVMELDVQGQLAASVLYAARDGSRVLLLTFSTHSGELGERGPIFEKSANTLKAR